MASRPRPAAVFLIGLVVGAVVALVHATDPLSRLAFAHPNDQTAPGASTAVNPVSLGGPIRDVTEFGARPDDDRDDTAAIQRGLSALRAGETLRFPPGTFRHNDVLVAKVGNTRLTGPGATLVATRESRSAFQVDADRVLVEDLSFTVESVTRRWEAYEQHKVRLSKRSSVVLSRIKVLGSAASGIFIDDGANRFVLDSVTVQDTQADGIHMTGGAHDGEVRHPVVTRSGDDGVAVVSYGGDGGVVRGIKITSPEVRSQRGGRGLSVVGGEQISFSDVLVEQSNGAAIYLAVEGDPYYTHAVSGVTVERGRISGANQNSSIDHGAVLIFSARSGKKVSNVRISDLEILDTRGSASRQVGILAEGGGVADIVFSRLAVRGGPATPFTSNVANSVYRLEGWLVNGRSYG